MRNKILVCAGFIVCFGIGFVCGMYAQSRIVAGRQEMPVSEMTMSDKIVALVDKQKAKENKNRDHVVKCLDGTLPDNHGCCTGEEYTDMGDLGFNCCPTSGGDCFPPIL